MPLSSHYSSKKKDQQHPAAPPATAVSASASATSVAASSLSASFYTTASSSSFVSNDCDRRCVKLIRRREDFVYIPQSFRILMKDSSCWSSCFGCCGVCSSSSSSNDETDGNNSNNSHTKRRQPEQQHCYRHSNKNTNTNHLLRQTEKALHRRRKSSYQRGRQRIWRIAYVYMALMAFLGWQGFVAWRQQGGGGTTESEEEPTHPTKEEPQQDQQQQPGQTASLPTAESKGFKASPSHLKLEQRALSGGNANTNANNQQALDNTVRMTSQDSWTAQDKQEATFASHHQSSATSNRNMNSNSKTEETLAEHLSRPLLSFLRGRRRNMKHVNAPDSTAGAVSDHKTNSDNTLIGSTLASTLARSTPNNINLNTRSSTNMNSINTITSSDSSVADDNANVNIRRFPYNKNLFFDAWHPNGKTKSYIADPTAFRTARQEFIQQLHNNKNKNNHGGSLMHHHHKHQHHKHDQEISNTPQAQANDFWATLQYFEPNTRQGTRTAHIPLTPNAVCGPAPGQGMEDEGGYKLFAEKIQLAPSTTDTLSHRSNNLGNNLGNNATMTQQRSGRVLCAVYSHASMTDIARTAALTWGHHCDGFLIFAGDSPSVPELGMVQLIFDSKQTQSQPKQQPESETGSDSTTTTTTTTSSSTKESYQNMWQKVRSIWAYLHFNYLDDYDYFHLGGDDMYVIPENLRYRLSQKAEELGDPNAPIFMGQQVPKDGRGQASFIAGGAGYTLNRAGLEKLVREALPNCHVETTAPYEDRLISACLGRIGIEPTDSRDPVTGEQTYHGVAPHTLFTTRISKNKHSSSNNNKSVKKRRQSFYANAKDFWSRQGHPQDSSHVVGAKHGLESAARYSVSFHNLFHPVFMARVHTLLYPQLCPSSARNSMAVAGDAATSG